METDSLLSLIQRSYRPEEYPALDHQIRLWQRAPVVGAADSGCHARISATRWSNTRPAGCRSPLVGRTVGLHRLRPEIVDRIRANGIPS